MKPKKYHVSFEIEGTAIGGDLRCNKRDLKQTILVELDKDASPYESDSKVTKLEITEIKEK